MRHLRGKVVLVVAAIAAAALSLTAQTPPAQKPQFEITSVKPNRLGRAAGPPQVTAERGRFVGSNAYLRLLLQFAYRPAAGRTLRDTDIVGVPGWADMERFDIEAKTEGGLNPSPEQLRLMVQSLLEDRFQLKAHWETREMATYNLVVAKNGAKLKPSEDQSATSVDARDPQASRRGSVRTIANPSPSGITVTVSGNALPIETVVSQLQSYAGRPVFDRTGLAGLFDMRIVFFMETRNANSPPQPTASDPSIPSLTTAIEEQLGLKLESGKGPVEVLVIESVQEPSEN